MRLPIKDMDREVVALCKAMNRMPGVQTTESCSGHFHDQFRIWFTVRRMEDLPFVCWCFHSSRTGIYGWVVIADTDDAMNPVHFMVEGPRGKIAYTGASEIAAMIEDHCDAMGQLRKLKAVK